MSSRPEGLIRSGVAMAAEIPRASRSATPARTHAPDLLRATTYLTQFEDAAMSAHSVSPLDLKGIPFARKPVWCRGTKGTRYQRWVPYGMPQLGQYKWISDVVFFLYQSVEDAQAGRASGGTGFLVAVPSEKWGRDYFHVHGVTNWHVACDGGASVLRVNLRQGGTEVIEHGPEEWTFRSVWHDIAISPPLRFDPRIHKVEAVWVEDLLTKEDISGDDIGPAEDVFTVGRFIDYAGKETNEPSFRFGNISIVNAEVKQPTKYMGNSLVLDMHSRTGYSGSPVWIYRTPGTVFARESDIAMTWHYIKLLGIQYGQFPELWEIKEQSSSKSTAAHAAFLTDGKYVEGWSGMSCAVPAAAIVELLADPKLREMRRMIDEEITPDMSTQVHPRSTAASYSTRFRRPQDAIERHLGLDQASLIGRGLW